MSEPVKIPRLYRLTVSGMREETPSVRTLALDLGGQELNYEAGQYVSLILKDAQDPRGNRRPFTLSSSPSEKGFLSITSKMTGSPFKNAFGALTAGDEVEVRGPFGDFTLLPDRDALMIAGGIGITPFRSMLRWAVDRGLQRRVVLLYSNSVEQEIAFRGELNQLCAESTPLRVVYTLTRAEQDSDWQGHRGRIDAQIIRREAVRLEEPVYYICGPSGLVEGMEQLLVQELEINDSDIRSEDFPGY